MKKISFITCWLAAIFLLLIAGCTDKETIQDNISGTPTGKTITLTATMGNDTQPKTKLGCESDGEGEFPGVIVRWSAGDAFRLFYKKSTETNIKSTIDFSIDATTIENDGKTATFKGTAPEIQHSKRSILPP